MVARKGDAMRKKVLLVFQCSEPCHQGTYDNHEAIEAMVERQRKLELFERSCPS